ncbi:hypothetical protein C9374_009421 [Naegleria lovaniensis]|uniref:Uncharacterized protein n=1 Tax=Naegleria lovaniensis TaxID=51637 RepID=A0AA88KRN9_NAELO|nr:uncharacterized protein C9374_009421 [Naegleria lovaniensis]KAG2392844.1 hypothetical protein C9374_009421 [Naegleria lovaniensis]
MVDQNTDNPNSSILTSDSSQVANEQVNQILQPPDGHAKKSKDSDYVQDRLFSTGENSKSQQQTMQEENKLDVFFGDDSFSFPSGTFGGSPGQTYEESIFQ